MVSALLELDGVSVRRGGQLALDSVTWRVYAGERWVVLGGNGAGKTTLLQVAATGLAPTTGRVRVLGEDLAVADVEELAPSVGIASAAVADLLPHTERVLDVVLTGAWALVRRGAEDYGAVDESRARLLLAQLGSLPLAQRRFGTLSEGERKRVQIARALMSDPELLLLDEPAAGLDLGGREALLARLTRLAADPASPALVLVTHHVEEVPTGFTHALLLRRGRVVAAGPLAATLTQQLLGATFGFPLQLSVADGRYAARAVWR